MTNKNYIDSITISLDDIDTMVQQEFDFSDINMSSAITLDSVGLDTITISGSSSSIINNNIYNIGSSNTGGYIYTTDSTNGWLNSEYSKSLSVQGDANIEGELTVQGVKLSDRLNKIEERLGILRPNEELEEKWENLRALRKAYMELEAEIIEKEAMWAILKK